MRECMIREKCGVEFFGRFIGTLLINTDSLQLGTLFLLIRPPIRVIYGSSKMLLMD
jgi:hypothetical protein